VRGRKRTRVRNEVSQDVWVFVMPGGARFHNGCNVTIKLTIRRTCRTACGENHP
jgi:hypothetical protein